MTPWIAIEGNHCQRARAMAALMALFVHDELEVEVSSELQWKRPRLLERAVTSAAYQRGGVLGWRNPSPNERALIACVATQSLSAEVFVRRADRAQPFVASLSDGEFMSVRLSTSELERFLDQLRARGLGSVCRAPA